MRRRLSPFIVALGFLFFWGSVAMFIATLTHE